MERESEEAKMQSNKIGETHGYLVAVLAVGLATATRLLLRHFEGWEAPLLLLALAVVVPTIYLWLVPVLLLTVLCAVVWNRLFTNSVILNLVVLLISGVIFCVLINLMI